MALTVGTITGWLDARYPQRLAESWDRVGLQVGDPDAEVNRVLFAVDPSDAVVAEARELGAQLIVTHHPLLLRGVHYIRRDEPKGRVVMSLVESGIAHYAAHTNADSARPGVADALADVIGLVDTQPLIPETEPGLDKLVTFVPEADVNSVIAALSNAGAGAIGNYDQCAFTSPGTGQFRPLEGSDPHIGQVGGLTRTPEVRVEMVLPRTRRAAVIQALLASHPYETPAFDLVEMADTPSDLGLGRIGRLPSPLPARELASKLAVGVPTTASGIKLGGNPNRLINTVCVLGGAGDSMLDTVRRTEADCYVTGDLRHHPAQDFLAWEDAPVLIDVPHFAAEWLWLPGARDMVLARASELGEPLSATVSTINTDPWTLRLES